MRPPTTLRLKNGTRVVLVPNETTAAATLMVMFEVGSRYETPEMSGASHFIEHMLFKGTERRPHSLDITRDLDGVGADYNAFTAKDHTEYYIRLQAGKLPLAIDMLDDMIFHSVFRKEDVASERSVIFEEIRMYEDNPSFLIEEMMEEELFDGHPLGRRISGTVETMNGIDRDALVSFRDRYYVPERTVIAVAGKFDRRKTMAMLEAKFSSGEVHGGAKAPAKYKRFRPPAPTAPRARIQKKDTEQVQVAFGWPGYGYDKPEKLSAMLLFATILGGTMSSRLFMSVREREGLCYFIKAGVNPYQDSGTFMMESGVAKARIHQAIELIMRETARLRDEGPTDEELSRAKEYIKGKTALRLEESSSLADWYAKQELLSGKTESPKSRLERIARLTAADLRKVARETIHKNALSVAVIGPYDDAAPFLAHADIL